MKTISRWLSVILTWYFLVPISYTIKSLTGEERVIVKQYKNQLIKVKKNVTVKAEAESVLA